jgi:hypothetical protein
MKKLSSESLLFFGFSLFSVFSLIAGYAANRLWGWVIAEAVLEVLWVVSKKYLSKTLGTFTLFITIGLAVIGIVLGNSSWLMICSLAFGLAAWEVVLLMVKMKDQVNDFELRQYLNAHLNMSCISLITGILLTLLGLRIRLEIPFIVMLALALLGVYILGRVWNFFIKHQGNKNGR